MISFIFLIIYSTYYMRLNLMINDLLFWVANPKNPINNSY